MKGSLLLLPLIVLVFLASCHKKPALPPGLVGKWLLSYSGSVDTTHYAFQRYTGPSRILQIQPDNKYSRYNSFSVVESGTYSILINDTTNGRLWAQVIVFKHDDTSYRRSFQVPNMQLFLDDYGADSLYPAKEEYQKIY